MRPSIANLLAAGGRSCYPASTTVTPNFKVDKRALRAGPR